MLVNQKTKQRENIYLTRIYLENCSMYNQMYNEDLLNDVREVKSWILYIETQGPLPLKRRYALVLLSVG